MCNFTISIVIPSYNSYRTIPATIENLLKQDNFCMVDEIIVVDSSDDHLTKEYLHSLNHDKIQIITSGIRVMPSIQRNIGAEQAKGDLLVFIDSDAYPAPRWLSKISCAYAQGWLIGGGGYLIPDFQKDNKIALSQYYFEFGEFLPFGEERIRPIVPSCNLFCDRKFFLKIGGFPEIRAAEDSLFCLTASKQAKLIFIPGACMYHIFRENLDDALRNLYLIGKHGYIFHKNYYNRLSLRKPAFYGLLPLLAIYKFLLRLSLIFRIHRSHYKSFIKSFRYFFKANNAWFKGFIAGSKAPADNVIIKRKNDIASLAIEEIITSPELQNEALNLSAYKG